MAVSWSGLYNPILEQRTQNRMLTIMNNASVKWGKDIKDKKRACFVFKQKKWADKFTSFQRTFSCFAEKTFKLSASEKTQHVFLRIYFVWQTLRMCNRSLTQIHGFALVSSLSFSFDQFHKNPLSGSMNSICCQFQRSFCLKTLHNGKSAQHVDDFHFCFHDSKSHPYAVSGTSSKRHVGHGVSSSFSLLGESTKKEKRNLVLYWCTCNTSALLCGLCGVGLQNLDRLSRTQDFERKDKQTFQEQIVPRFLVPTLLSLYEFQSCW